MKKRYWFYGAGMGLILIVLQIFHSMIMIRDVEIELFGLVIAVIFMVVGIWVGRQVYRRKERSAVDKLKASDYGLSVREIDVLGLMIDGLSNQEIADGLFVSLNTAKTHISNIYQKLNVKRRTQAVQKVRELQLMGST